jgi:hypothetical protein
MTAVSCPRCRRPQRRLRERCAQCGADLTALMRVVERADGAYDVAVRAARAGRWAEAGEQASVALAFVPDDVDAIVLLAKVAQRQGRRERSAELWERAGELAPDRADAPVALAALRTPVGPAERARAMLPSRDQVRAALPTRAELADLARAVSARGAARWSARSSRGRRNRGGR